MNKEIAAQLAGLSAEEQRALLQQLLQKKNEKQSLKDKTAVLSFGQERLLFLHQLDPKSAAYNLRTAVKLEGDLNIPILAQSIQDVADRHEGLRTKIVTANGSSQQQIQAQLDIPLPIIDLSDKTGAELETAVQQASDSEAQTPFDLANGPLFRAKLLKLSENTHILLLTMHHIISDGWSIGILIREIGMLYQTKLSNTPSPLLDLNVQYGDFAAWQREWLQGETLQTQLAYWRDALQDTAVIDLPTDHPRPPVQTFNGARHYFTIDPSIADHLRRLTHAENATLFMSLLTTFNILLHQYSGQTDIAVGTPVAGRNRNQLESVIGLFINTLVMRSNIEPTATFRAQLAQMRQKALDAFAHQDIPFEKIVEELHPARDPSRTPYFQHLFILQNAPMQALQIADLNLTTMQPNKASSLFDITMTMWDNEEGMRGYLEYNTDLFADATMAQFVTHFQQLLHQVCQHPDLPIAQLSPLLPSEREQILVAWNETKRPYPTQTLTQLFSQQAAKTPEAVAITAVNGTLTYAELEAQSNQLAAYLQQFDISPDTLIGLAVPRQKEMLIAILGILKAGAAYLPIDPTYPDQRIQYMLDHAQAPVLITTSAIVDKLPEHQAKTILIDADWDKIAVVNSELRDASSLDDLAYVIYTSGSTGKPKGVQITNRNIANFLYSMQEIFTPSSQDLLLAVTTLSFDIATLELYLPLISGAQLLLADEEMSKDATLLVEQLETRPITIMQATPATWQMLLLAEWRGKADLTILSGGEALPAALAKELLSCGTAVFNMYGPTETTVWSTYLKVEREDCHTEGVISVGTPIANTDVYILDDHLNPVPIGVTANLYIGGTGVARGYLHRPDLTADRFIEHPFKPNERIYLTGDVARYQRNGRLEFLGRSDHQVKIRGFRIELGEIENNLQQHPAISQAVVHPQAEQLVAYLICKAGAAQPDVTALREHIQQSLPAYMVPHRFVFMEAYPLTPNGKVDRKALPNPADLTINTGNYVAPRSPIEEALVTIWQDLLNAPQVGIEDNFFELGGHSLLATQLVSRVRQTLNVELPLRALFEAGTIADLAQIIAQAEDKPLAPPIAIVDSADAKPLSFAQQRLWVLEQLEPNLAAYHIPAVVRLEGELDTETLQTAFNQLLARHAALRTTFAINPEGEPIQQVHEDVVLAIPITPTKEDDVADQLKLIVKRPFSLQTPPLIRVELLQVAADDHLLVIVMHHIVSDGWSMNILVREIATLYHALAGNYPNPLPQLPIQYPDFAAWQRSWLQGEVLQEQLDYWQQRLANAPATLDLPTDFPRPAMQSYAGATYRHNLPTGMSEHIIQFSRQANATPFMTLIAAYQLLLARYSGQNDIVIGSPIANRNRQEIENLIGFFVNMLVLRTQIDVDDNFHTVLAQVRQNALDGYAHQDVPFEKLVDVLNISRDMSYTPIFQAAFILQNAPRSEIDLGNVTMSVVPAEGNTAKYDLTLTVLDTEKGFRLLWEYCTDLFAEETIQRLATHFVYLLENVLTNPQQPVAELPLFSEAEQKKVLTEWNDTKRPYPTQTLTQLFSAQAQQTPENIAVTAVNGNLTYAELEKQSNQLAAYLRQYDMQPDTLIGLALPRQKEMLVGILGILKAGAAYLPIDPAYPAQRIQYMLEHAQAPVLITTADLVDGLPEHQAQTVLIDSDWDSIAALPTQTEDCSSLDHLAYVIYTSGSTGKPKGVQITNRNIANFLCSMQETFVPTAKDILLAVTTLSFDIATLELYLPLISGAHVLLADQATSKDASQLVTILEREPVTMMQATPATWQMLLLAGWQGKADLTILSGGEALPAALAKQLLGCGTAVYNMYGPTETTVWSTYLKVETEDCNTDGVISVGRPIANTDVYILDEYLNPVPIGVTGNLYIGGTGVARGYLHQPDLTAERFIEHPFKPNERIYHTGDVARYQRNGRIDFLGRSDHQVKIRGFRIELGEIENSLQQHSAISQAVVHPQEEQLVAYLICKTEAKQPTVVTLRDHIQQSLPAYMVPQRFIFMEAYPLTPNGKVDRKALPKPDSAAPMRTKEVVPPRNEEEAKLAAIWQTLLNTTTISVHDNFFELGGDSLLLLRTVAQAKQVGLKITPQQFIQNQTIAQLVTVAESFDATAENEQILTGKFPIMPGQDWLLKRLHQQKDSHWNLGFLFEVDIPLPLELVQEVLRTMMNYHDVLRTHFTYDEQAGWQQEIIPLADELPFTYLDLSAIADEEIEDYVEATYKKEHQALNLAENNLLNLIYMDFGPQRSNRLLLVVHHLLYDGYSINLLLADMLRTMQQLLQQQTVSLPTKTTSIQTFAARLKEYTLSDEYKEEIDYWLSHPWQFTPLPLDFPENIAQNNLGSTQTISLSFNQTETTQLLQLLQSYEGVQMSDLLLSALTHTLTDWTKSEWLQVATVDNGRFLLPDLDIDLSRTMGYIATHPVFIFNRNKQASPLQTMTAIREQITATPHHGLGYMSLKTYLPNGPQKDALLDVFKNEITFNYEGIQAVNMNEDGTAFTGPFRPAPQYMNRGIQANPNQDRGLIFYFGSHIDANGQLIFNWQYSENLHKEETITHLAAQFQTHVVSILNNATAHVAPRNPIEETMVAIWQKLLNVPQVGIHENFFELGGDSILAMRFIAQARDKGILFQANQMFQKQTIAELAELADTKRPYPLTPVQTNLMQANSEPIILQLASKTAINADRLQQAMALMQQEIPNLQIQFSQNEDGMWQQQAATLFSPPVVVDTAVLTELTDKKEQAKALQNSLAALTQQLKQESPPHLAATIIQLPEQEMLLFAISSLVADRAALPHLLTALTQAYQLDGLENLPQTSWQEWHAAEPPVIDPAYWQAMETELAPLPTEYVNGSKQNKQPLIKQRLEARYTADLQQVQERYNMSLEEVILTAVSQTITSWQKSNHLWLLRTQYHRAVAINGLNTLHTIGHYQTNVPLYLQAPTETSTDSWLQQTKTAVRQQPIITQEQPELWPNTPSVSVVWQPAVAPTKLWAPLSVKATHGMATPLTIVVGQIGEQIHLEWHYDPAQFKQSTILTLSKQWQAHIDALIAHAAAVETRQLSAADFPEAQIDQTQLAQFLTKLGNKKKE